MLSPNKYTDVRGCAARHARDPRSQIPRMASESGPERHLFRLVFHTLSLIAIACSPAQRTSKWIVDEGPPCSPIKLTEFMQSFDTLSPCARYQRIENALRSESPPYLNRVMSWSPDTSCLFSRWGISQDPRVEEDLAYHLLVCYQSRMGNKWVDDGVVYRISRRKAEVERDALTAVHRQMEFLQDLKVYLGCVEINSGRNTK